MKVGDRVRITGDPIMTHDDGVPDEGIIVDISPAPNPESNLTHTVVVDEEYIGPGSEWDRSAPFAEDELELIEEKK